MVVKESAFAVSPRGTTLLFSQAAWEVILKVLITYKASSTNHPKSILFLDDVLIFFLNFPQPL
jgi:hypothetical protein